MGVFISSLVIIIKIKRNKHLKYISLCGMNVYIIQVSLLNGISEINQLFDDILIIRSAPVYIYIYGRKLTISSWNMIFT